MLVSAFASFSSRPIPPISATFSVREIQHACLPRMSWRTSEKSVRTFCVRKNAKGSGNGNGKLVWIWTKNKEVMTSAVERGWNTFIFGSEDKDLASQWASTATIQPLFVGNGRLYDHENKQVGLFAEISSPSQLEEINKMAGQSENVIIDCLDWQIIPAENVVAAFQDSGTSTFAVTNNVQDAQVFFEALERGMDGVILHTDDVQLIFELKAYFNRRDNLKDVINLNVATVTQVEGMGMGDRVCVDLCSLLFPGEGLLVGSFSKGLFLVHSECLESSYIASRPFRVNAGPVHAYVAIPDGKTCYLSELESGREIIVVDSTGRQRKAIVGRVKIESRPLILIKAKVESAKCYECSILLQNAETVSLVSSFEGGQAKQLAVPISMLQVGDKVLVSLQECARHTGLPINEFVIER
eukprot:TRINITY_DN6776_c0_g2_i3.p1 TRINITY_DN6776_c0_g2~~TRINITY_DN6776_c0_g2_i3.p1  ORF type:complete len:412 (+),score=81.25 TRINITY_DN6776_c0_g2_i3:258-1493(+)